MLISTLAQLIMDPGCRTLDGFLELVEREWIQVTDHFPPPDLKTSCHHVSMKVSPKTGSAVSCLPHAAAVDSCNACPKRWNGNVFFVVFFNRAGFLQAGHPFHQRCAHSAYSHARVQQESPFFLLLLDCVWQIWEQFPLALGFSKALLLRLATEAYASNYGTFLCNRHQER